MIGTRLFFRQPATSETAAVDPVGSSVPAGGRTASAEDAYEAGRAKREVGGATPPPGASSGSGSFMGALFGSLGRFKKSAACAILGAVALTSVGTGGAVAAESVPRNLEPDHQVVETVGRTTAAQTARADYEVKKGDNLWRIAQRHDLTLAALVAANPQIRNPALIYPGQAIHIPRAAAAEPAAVTAAPVTTAPVTTAPVTPTVEVMNPSTTISFDDVIAHAPGVPAVAPSGPGAPVPPSTPEPAPLMETNRLVVRALREVNELALELLADRDVDFDRSWPLGEAFEAKVGFEAAFEDKTSGDWERMAFERLQKKAERETLWVRSEGSIALEGARESETRKVGGEVELGYSMVRPFTYAKKDPDPVAAAKAFVTNIYTLPLSHEAASELDQGAAFELRGLAKVTASGEVSVAKVSGGVDANLHLEVRKLAGSRVEVTYDREAGIDARLDADDLSNGRVDLDLSFAADRHRKQTFRFDLDQPQGQKAYDAILAFKASQAAALAKIAGNGVDLVREDYGSSRELKGALRYQPDAEHDLTFRLGSERERDGEETSHRLTGGIDAAIKPENEDIEGRIKLGAERFEDDDVKRRSVSGEGQVKSALSDKTELTVTTRVEAGHEVNDRWEQETRNGRLAHGGVLSTKLLDDTGKPVNLGFDANAEVSFVLVTPKGVDGVVPLTGRQMQRAAEGTRLTLVGKGKLGLDAKRKLDNLDLSMQASAAGQIQIRAYRFDGDEVRVSVELDREIEGSGQAGLTIASEESRYSASIRHEADREHEMSASFQLSMNKASHREAYGALLKGNLGPASRILDLEAPSWVKSTSNAQTFKLSAAPVEWFEAGLEIHRRDVDPKDARIRWNDGRQAFTEASQKAGHEVRWIEAEGALAPKVSYKGSAPVGGALTWRHGFSGERAVRYRAFAPSLDGQPATLDPALTADLALAMPRGAEFEMMGRGKVSGFTGLGFGTEWGSGGIVATATASADTTHSYARTWEVEVERLEGSKVQVALEKGSDRNNAFEIAARAGVQVDSEELLGLESAEDRLGLLGKATEALDEEIEKRLAFELEASWTKGKASSERLTFEVDLSKAGARDAYEQLVELDGASAIALVRAGEGSGVKILRERSSDSVEIHQHAHADIFGERLFLTDALRRDSTVIEQWDGGGRRTDESTYREKYEGLFGREQDMSWQAVRVRPQGDAVGRGYYRLQYEDKDPLTSKQEVRRVLALAQDLQAQPARPIKVKKGARGIKKLFGSAARHGKTKLEMDIFFTEKGIDLIRGHDRFAAIQRYGEVTAARQGRGAFGWADPAKSAKAIEILEEYRKVDEDPFHDEDTRDDLRSLEVEYWRLTRNELWEDKADFYAAQGFGDMVGRMHGSKDPAEWNKAFADLGEAVGFDFFDALATMQKIAGADELVVHQMQMKGRAVDIEMTDEGLLRRP